MNRTSRRQIIIADELVKMPAKVMEFAASQVPVFATYTPIERFQLSLDRIHFNTVASLNSAFNWLIYGKVDSELVQLVRFLIEKHLSYDWRTLAPHEQAWLLDNMQSWFQWNPEAKPPPGQILSDIEIDDAVCVFFDLAPILKQHFCNTILSTYYFLALWQDKSQLPFDLTPWSGRKLNTERLIVCKLTGSVSNELLAQLIFRREKHKLGMKHAFPTEIRAFAVKTYNMFVKFTEKFELENSVLESCTAQIPLVFAYDDSTRLERKSILKWMNGECRKFGLKLYPTCSVLFYRILLLLKQKFGVDLQHYHAFPLKLNL